MSLIFRKSVRLAPGIRMTLSKRGASLSAGPRGAKAAANTRGQRRTSLSFKGFSWRKRGW